MKAPIPVQVFTSRHYSFVALVVRDMFRWRWLVVQLPGMSPVASGHSWKLLTAQNRSFDVALAHALGVE